MFDTGFVQQNAKPVLGGEFMSSFVLGVTRDGRALLTLEKRGNETKLAIPGGKAMAGENSFATAARGAHEESGGALSEMTRLRIARGAGVRGQVEFNSAIAVLMFYGCTSTIKNTRQNTYVLGRYFTGVQVGCKIRGRIRTNTCRPL